MKRTPLLAIAIFLACAGTVSAAPGPKIGNGKKVALSYQLFVNGTLLETADSKNPFTYVHGQNQIVPGLEKGLTGLRVGDEKTIRVTPNEAYGPVNPKAFQEVAKDKLPSDIPQKKGTLIEARNPRGESRLVRIFEVKEKTVVIDFNHPLAGKELEFRIKVLSIT